MPEGGMHHAQPSHCAQRFYTQFVQGNLFDGAVA
jgi:hypothetical protein